MTRSRCLPNLVLAAILHQGHAAAQVGPELRERYVQARTLMGEERYPEAWEALQELVTDEPRFTPAYRSFVEASLLIDDVPAAASYFEGRIAADPDDAYAHYGRGVAAVAMDDFDRAIQSHARAIELEPTLVEALDDRGGIMRAYRGNDALDEALRYAQGLVASSPENPAFHYGLARVRLMRYEWEAALESAERAVSLDPETLRAQSLIVYAHSRSSPSRELLDEIERLRVLAFGAADLDMESYAELQFGVAYQNFGDYGLSLRHVSEGLRLARLYGQTGRELILLNNIATLYATAGNMDQAQRFFAQVVEHAGGAGEKDLEIIALVNLGHTIRETDVDAGGPYYERGLELARDGGFKHGECLALHSLGASEAERGNVARADTILAEALDCTREIGDRRQEGHVLEQIAYDAEQQGRLEEAVGLYRQALAIGEEIDNIEILWDVEGGLASTFEKLGDDAKALEHNERAIAIYESVRATLDIESVGSGFLNDKDEVYPSMVRLLARAGRVDEAFDFAERYKAKGLLENLSQNAGLLSELLPESLRRRIQDVERRLIATHESLAEAIERDEIVALEQRVSELELEKAALNRELQENHGEFYRLTRSEPLGVEAIQAQILDENQVLLEYVVGENDTSVFVIDDNDVHYRLLPVGRTELIEKMQAWSPVFQGRDASEGSYFNPALADFSLPDARALYEALLEPVETLLPDGSELIVVPDDVLFYVPFEALALDYDRDGPFDFERATFLLERHAISYASAASLLEPVERAREIPPGTLLALGNPSFDATVDEADASGTLAVTASYASPVVRDGGLAPLPHSEDEVRAIATVVGGSSRVAVGTEASEALFKNEASNYRILHIATHFLTNDRRPLFSKLALAPASRGEDDGWLQVYEVLDAKLRAEMVVLSACNTGIGRLQRGEGLLGTTRAFLYAGVPSTVVSLWSVEDSATATIMERFYHHLAEGMNKREALRHAKLDYLASARGEKKDPFYWAPFVLMGDWTPMSFPDSTNRWAWWAVVALAAAAATLAWKRRRA